MAVVIHVGDIEDDVSYGGELPLVAVSTLQRGPAFHAIFNQLGFNGEARKVETEALVSIASNSGTYCCTAEAHANKVFLENTNTITFTDEDMEVQHPDYNKPLYVVAQINDVSI